MKKAILQFAASGATLNSVPDPGLLQPEIRGEAVQVSGNHRRYGQPLCQAFWAGGAAQSAPEVITTGKATLCDFRVGSFAG